MVSNYENRKIKLDAQAIKANDLCPKCRKGKMIYKIWLYQCDACGFKARVSPEEKK